jgi:hypothetical protein
MRMGLTCAAVLAAGVLRAQDLPPDVSGRWRLVELTVTERALDTLAIASPDELLITQTPFAVIVEHPSRPGTHPEAKTFEYGSGGVVEDLGDRGLSTGTWSVSYVGTQLTISRSTTYPPDERGARTTVASGSMWRLETSNRLVIEFGEERSGERPKVATRAYIRQGDAPIAPRIPPRGAVP